MKKTLRVVLIIFVIVVIVPILMILVYKRSKLLINKFELPENVSEIYSSSSSDELLLIIDGKINLYDTKGNITEYYTDYDVSFVKYNDKEALLIDENANLYKYSFEKKESSEKLLSNVSNCDLSSCGVLQSYAYAAVTKSGELYVWGNNKYKHLGTDDNYIKEPRRVDSLSNIISVDLNGNYSLALSGNGEVYECGLIYYHSTKEPIYKSEFTKIDGIDGAEQIFSGYANIVLSSNGKFTYWDRRYDQNTYQSIDVPENKEISSICQKKKITDISKGGKYFIGRNNNGDIYLWGRNIAEKNRSFAIITIDLPRKIYHVRNIDGIYTGYNHAWIKTKNKIIMIGQ